MPKPPQIDTFLRDAQVTATTGIPRSTRYELIEKGAFPRPIRLSPRIVAWSASEIAEWQRKRIEERGTSGATAPSHSPPPLRGGGADAKAERAAGGAAVEARHQTQAEDQEAGAQGSEALRAEGQGGREGQDKEQVPKGQGS
jgi:prophage regulatory protein